MYGRGIYRQLSDVPVVGRWQLASRWCLLQIACRPDASNGSIYMEITGPHSVTPFETGYGAIFERF